MSVHRRDDDDDSGGFTLIELLVAITILGIIMGAIGAMIATAFRTSSTVSSQLNGSRGPKVVSRYWVPDVEEAAQVQVGAGGCGDGNPVVTFTSKAFASNIDTQDATADDGATRTITWAVKSFGTRDQLVRFLCAPGAPMDTTVIVADVDGVPTVDAATAPGRKTTIHVTVPDRAASAKQFSFDVSATEQVSPGSTP